MERVEDPALVRFAGVATARALRSLRTLAGAIGARSPLERPQRAATASRVVKGRFRPDSP
jgi:hypothetical protein